MSSNKIMTASKFLKIVVGCALAIATAMYLTSCKKDNSFVRSNKPKSTVYVKVESVDLDGTIGSSPISSFKY